MNIEKLMTRMGHSGETFPESMGSLLMGSPDQWDRDALLRTLSDYNARLYGSASQEWPEMNELSLGELLHNVEILLRLEKALGSWLSFEECIALSQVIYLHHFLYSDGFLINDPRDQGRTIGKADGATIAACFHPDPAITGLDVEYGYHSTIPAYGAMKGRIIQQILSGDAVRLVGSDDLPSLVD